jgi:hypothetical protein
VMAPAPVRAQANGYSLRIENDSSFAIYRVFVSPTGAPDWGSDRLSTRILHPGLVLTVPGLPPGPYDVWFVDEDSDQCVVWRTYISDHTFWRIANSWLPACEGCL